MEHTGTACHITGPFGCNRFVLTIHLTQTAGIAEAAVSENPQTLSQTSKVLQSS